MSVAPDKVKEFILDNVSHQVKSSHKDSETCGEGYDYRMEEANKAFKDSNLHTKQPSIEDWNLVCSNTYILKCMKELQSNRPYLARRFWMKMALVAPSIKR